MRICFDYKGASPEDIQAVLECFFEKYGKIKGSDGEPIEIGKINIYIAMNNQTDNTSVGIMRGGEELSWVVKNRKLKTTSKTLIGELQSQEDEDDSLFLYEATGGKNWRY